MRKRFVVAMLAVTLMACGLHVQSVSGISPDILISQIKVGNSTTSRLVEIYNNSDSSVDISNWCLVYSSPSNATPYTKLGCFDASSDNVHIFIQPRSYALLASSQTGLLSDILLEAGLGTGTSGHVYLMNGDDNEVDRVGWGLAVNAEGGSPVALGSTKVIERRLDDVSGLLIDTDNNNDDFVISVMRQEYQYGALDEVIDVCLNQSGIQEEVPAGYLIDESGNCAPPPVDLCGNIDGMQSTVPAGYALDEYGDCVPDVCSNLDGIQAVLPEGKEFGQSGECIDIDVCPSLTGIQAELPEGYKYQADGQCVLDLLPIIITELLPNPYGTDAGNEFIELYNPGDTAIDLAFYRLEVGIGTVKQYAFPEGSSIGPKEYYVIYNGEMPFVLANAFGKVTLRSVDGQMIDDTPQYSDAKDDASWSLIDDVWQYTNRATPGGVNLSMLIEDDGVVEGISTLKPCAANQYRSLETGRCRLLSPATSVLAPCKDGQYRSEETNRCRSIASDAAALVPCDVGQERNPLTNRCRLIASSATVPAACKPGQERNLETNRCRNIVKMSDVNYPVEEIVASSGDSAGWWAIGGVGALAAGYGAWEWRSEILSASTKIRRFIRAKK